MIVLDDEMIRDKAREIHKICKSKGFYDEDRSIDQIQCLFHEEISEAFTVLRKDPFAKSDKIPDHLHFNEEIADLLIRILDTMYFVFPDQEWSILNNVVDYDEFDLENPNYELINNLHDFVSVNCVDILDLEWSLYGMSLTVDYILSTFGYDIWMVTLDKIEYNKTRPMLHGKNF